MENNIREKAASLVKSMNAKNKNALKGIARCLKFKHPDIYQFYIEEMKRINIDSIGEMSYLLLHDMIEPPMCPDCQVNRRRYGFDSSTKTHGYLPRCGKCGSKHNGSLISKRYTERTGYSAPIANPEVRQSMIQKMMEKEGVEWSTQTKSSIEKRMSSYAKNNGGVGFASKSVLEKINESCIRNNNCAMFEINKTEEHKRKVRETSMKRFGYSNWMKTDEAKQHYHNIFVTQEIIDKVKNFLAKYDLELVSEYYNAITPIKVKHIPCGEIFELSSYNQVQAGIISPLCRKCFHINSGISTAEIMIKKALEKEFPDIKIETNVRSIIDSHKELDIYIKELKLAIEYCGLYWHSSNTINDLRTLENDYHRSKYLKCREKGIRLLTLFENIGLDIWIDYIISVIKNEDEYSLEPIKIKDQDYLMLDNRYISYNFLRNKQEYKLIGSLQEQAWFWESYDHDMLRYDDFKKSFCTENEDPFVIAQSYNYNWIFDCGYQIIQKIV